MSRSSRRKRGSTPTPDRDTRSRPAADAPHPAWYTRIPIAATALTLVVLVSALFAVPPIRDAVTLQPTPDASLRLPLGYALLAPLSNVLDTLTLLAVPQHIAVGVWAIILYVGIRQWRVATGRAARGIVAEVKGAASLLGGIVLVYAAVAYLPRPMARLEVIPGDVYAVDFHLHTKFSHDGRSSFTPTRARAWARDAGYDAAYITDHATFDGATAGLANNPASAGQGTMLLQGIEGIYNGEHVNVLNAGRRFRNLMSPDLKEVDPQLLALMSTLGNMEPVVIETVPGDLSKIVPTRPRIAGMRAIEIVDGSPRGLTQTRRERDRIIRVSDSLHLARVSGSDNHGYGRAAAAWTLLRAENWKVLSGDSLSKVIELTIRVAGAEGTSVVERRIAGGTNVFTAALTPVLVPWRMFTTLSMEERVPWIVWTWMLTFGARWWRAREPDPTS